MGFRTRSLLLTVPFLWAVYALAAPPAGTHANPPKDAHTVHWAYSGAEAPAHWGELDPAYAACGNGKKQSPIDLTNARPQDLKNPIMHYEPSELRVLNNGHTVQDNYDKGSYLELNGQRYDVVQFHYHAPSEHTLNGKSFPAELHIVHKNAQGQLAVIGILLDEGAENLAYRPLVTHLPGHESPEAAQGVKVDLTALLPKAHTTFRYDGSLTAPPCTEGVSWLVMTTPVQVSAQQIAALEKVFKGNNRPLQPLNGRTLTQDTTP